MFEWGKYIVKMIEFNLIIFCGFGLDEFKFNCFYVVFDSGKWIWMEDIYELNDEDLSYIGWIIDF